jgi:hypothetical protein
LSAYRYTDVAPAAGIYFYRIKSIAESGKTLLTAAKKITIINKKAGMFVFPNPVEDGHIQLRMNEVEKGRYTFKLMSIGGQILYSISIDYDGGSSTVVLHPSENLLAGNYRLEVVINNKKINNIAVMVK